MPIRNRGERAAPTSEHPRRPTAPTVSGRPAFPLPHLERVEPRQLFAAAPAGGLDAGFGKRGVATASTGLGENDVVVAIDAGTGRRPVVAVETRDVGAGYGTLGGTLRLFRLTPTGNPDAKFRSADGLSGLLSFGGLAVQPGGKVVLSGTTIQGTVVRRLNADGSPDATFGDVAAAGGDLDAGTPGQVVLRPPDPGFDYAYGPTAPRVAADGRIVVGGGVSDYDPTGPTDQLPAYRFAAVRLTPAGTLDPTFGGDGAVTLDGAEGYATGVALQPDGKVVLGGQYSDYDGDTGARVVRVNADGSPDTLFSEYNSASGDSDDLLGLEVGPDGDLYFVVDYTAGSDFVRPFRTDADGVTNYHFEHFQTRFGGSYGGGNSGGLSVGPDGRLLLFGSFDALDPTTDFGLAPAAPGYPDPLLEGAIRWDPDGTYDRTFGTGAGVAGSIVSQAGTVQSAGGGRVLTAAILGGDLLVERRRHGPTKPAAKPAVALSPDGALVVEGTAGADTIEVVPAGAKVRVTAGKVVKSFPAAAVRTVFVEGGDGDDTLHVEGLAVASQVNGGGGADAITGDGTLYGEAGDDHIFIVGGASAVGGYGSDTIDNSFGDEYANALFGYEPGFNDHNEDDGINTLTYERRTGPVNLLTSINYFAYSVSGRGFDVLIGGMGNDVLKVAKADGTTGPNDEQVHFVGGPGDDLLVGGNQDDILDGGPGLDRIYGEDGDDTLIGEDGGTADYLDGGNGEDKAAKDKYDAVFGVEVIG